MSLDSPVQIDLSDDASWDQSQLNDKLTQEEKDFLKEKFNEESEGIIYLTQQELDDLKSIIAIPMDSSRHMSVERFINTQTTEWLAVSDIVESNQDLPDIIRAQIEGSIDGLEEIANEQLFWEEGMFSSLDISPTAQDHMRVSMSLSFMQHGMWVLQEKIDNNTLTIDDITALNDLWEELELKFAEIKGVADTVLPVMWSPSSIHIAQNWELNKIFMDPSEWISFFDSIISGEIEATNIEERLEAGNVDSAEDITVDLPQISNALNWNISKMAQSIENMSPEQRNELFGALQQASTSGTGAPNSWAWETSESNDSNDKKSIWESIMELFKNFFDWFIDLSDGNDGNEDDWENQVTAPEEIKNQLVSVRASLLSKLSQWAFIGMQESSLKEFFESDTSLSSIISIIDEIPDLGQQDTVEEKIDNLFFSPISSDASVMKIDAFMDANSLEGYKNADGSLNSKNLLIILGKYKNYREAYSEDNALTYAQYAKNTLSENTDQN